MGIKHGARSKSSFIISGGIVSIVFPIFFGVLSFWMSDEPVVNLIFLAVMTMLMWLGLWSKRAGLWAMQVCHIDLIMLTKNLEQLESDPETSVWKKLKESKPKSERLTKAIDALYKEYDALARYEDAHAHCDVAEFINEALVDEIRNAEFNEFVPNALTGLGILGTFVGLALGLQSFDTGSTAAISGSIAPLIDGIKVAFLTSIFGVALSLTYGVYAQYYTKCTTMALGEFQNKFYEQSGN